MHTAEAHRLLELAPVELGRSERVVQRVRGRRHPRLAAAGDPRRGQLGPLDEPSLRVADGGVHALLGGYGADDLGDDEIGLLGQCDGGGEALEHLDRALEARLADGLPRSARRLGLRLDGVDLARACAGGDEGQQGEWTGADFEHGQLALLAGEACPDRLFEERRAALVISHRLVCLLVEADEAGVVEAVSRLPCGGQLRRCGAARPDHAEGGKRCDRGHGGAAGRERRVVLRDEVLVAVRVGHDGCAGARACWAHRVEAEAGDSAAEQARERHFATISLVKLARGEAKRSEVPACEL